MIEQGSVEWRLQRAGKVTASRIADLTAKTKSGWGASRANYMAQLIAEILTGIPADSFTNAAMQWGTDTEPQARAAYEFFSGSEVLPAEFVDHPIIPSCGASPDGYVGAEGLLELKCPQTATHIETLLGGTVPNKYMGQMQWQMACTGRQWVDFASFDPRMPGNMQLFIKRVPRNDALIAEIEREVLAFLAEVQTTVARLKATYGDLASAA